MLVVPDGVLFPFLDYAIVLGFRNVPCVASLELLLDVR